MGIRTFFNPNLPVLFRIQNISNKVFRVFNRQIHPGGTYDLMRLPYISEDNIKHSLIKGELYNKLSKNQIAIIDNNIDLFIENEELANFLRNVGLKIVSGNAKRQITQSEWYVNSTTGDDTNVGTENAPIKTLKELRDRLYEGELLQDTNIYLFGDFSDEVLDINTSLTDLHTLRIFGMTPNILHEGTFTGQGLGGAQGQWQELEDNQIDWTPFSGHRIRLTSGSDAGAIAWLGKVDFDGGGNGTIRSTRFGTLPVGSSATSFKTINGNENYVVEELTKVGGFRLKIIRGTEGSVASQQIVQIHDVHFEGVVQTFITANPSIGPYVFIGCRIIPVGFAPGSCFYIMCRAGSPTSVLQNGTSGNRSIYATCLITCIALTVFDNGSHVSIEQRSLIERLGASFNGLTALWGGLLFVAGPIAIFDQTLGSLGAINCRFGAGVTLFSANQIHGDDINGVGINVEGGSIVSYDTKPTITGTAGAVKLGATVLADYSTIPTFNTTEGAGLVKRS